MPNRRLTILTILTVALLTSGALAAPMRGGGPARLRAVSAPAVVDYVPQIDGPMTTITAPDGSLWAVWSYRASGEYDVAIASLDPAGAWSVPMFFGRRDGIDETAPALAIDASRNLYLVYATRQPGGLAYATFTPATGTWSAPTRLSADRTASSPAIRIVGDRVIVAWRAASGTVLIDLPTVSGLTTRGIQDGPDSVDPLGVVPSSGSSGGNGSGVTPGSGGGSGQHGNGHK